MTYFGIPNLNYYENHFINDLNLFPNISEEILLNNIATKKNYDISINNEEKVHLDSINYDPIPILFQHRNNYMLKDIWKNINHGDIITNRASKRSLIYSIERVNVEKKWIEFDNDEHDKMIYLIYKKSDIVGNVPTYNKFEINLLASTLVFNNLINHSHTIYKYMKSYNEALRCFEHYTCEIDGFVKTEINNETVYKPVAFKTMENSGNKPMDIDNDGAKINIAVPCKLSDVNNVIFGFRYDSKMELKYYDIPTIINGVEYKINKAFKRMKDNTAKIVHHCKRSQFLSLHDQHQL